MKWFKTKVTYEKTDEENGKVKKVSDYHLFDAVNFIEAETRATEEMEKILSVTFKIPTINPTEINEIFAYEDGDYWFEATVSMPCLDEENGKLKDSSLKYLVMADDFESALARLKSELSDSVYDFTVKSLSESKIIEVFKHIKTEEDE